METKKQTGKGILILDHGNQTFEKINSSLKVSDFSLVALDHIAQSSSALASHAHVLRSLSRVPAPLTSAEPKDKFLSHCSQISAGDHMQIIGDPIGAVEVKVLTSQTHTCKLGRV